MNPGYQPKFDAAESAFTALALSYVETQVYETLFPPIEGRQYVPIDHSAPPGAKDARFRMFTRTGVAQFITDATDDLPSVGLFVKEYSHDFQAIGSHYEYSYMDVLAAGMSMKNGGPPVNLDLELGIAARESIERKLDRISAFGSTDATDPTLGLLGLLNLANTTIYAVANGVASGTQAWSGKTPDEIIADLTGVIAGQISGTYKVHKPKRILLPILQHETIAGRSMGDGRSDTILSYFVRTRKDSGHPVEVASWQHCSGNGAGGSDRGVAYDPNPRYVRHMVSMEFTQLPPERKGLKWKTDCLAKTAGVICPYPLSVSYFDHI